MKQDTKETLAGIVVLGSPIIFAATLVGGVVGLVIAAVVVGLLVA